MCIIGRIQKKELTRTAGSEFAHVIANHHSKENN